MKRNVLIATYYWPPSGGPGVQRYLKFAKYLPEFGIEPIILTVENPTYPTRDDTLVKEVPESLHIYRSKTIEPFRFYAGLSGKNAESIKPTVELEGGSAKSKIGSWIRANIFIPDARAGWLLTARRKAEKLAEDHQIDSVITTGPPHSVHFIGKHLQKKRGTRWLADFRDPWTSIYYNQLLPRTRLAEQIDEKLEKSVLKEADEVIVVSRTQAEEFRDIAERGYRIITNGFDPDDFTPIPEGREDRDTFLIRHIGTVGEASIPDTFLGILAKVYNEHNLRLEFIGDVHQALKERVEKLELTGVVNFQPYMPHRIALEKMVRADALLLCIPDVGQIRHHIPGKLFEYLGSGRPILLLGPENGDAADILREEKAGLICPFNDSGSIRKALKTLAEGRVPPRSIQDLRGHRYSRRTLAEMLSTLLKPTDREMHHDERPAG